MIEVYESAVFSKWLNKLMDAEAKARIRTRIYRIQDGNFGDVKPIGGGLSEARINYGPGYRVYFMKHGSFVVILLAGGDKSSQSTDITKAHEIAKQWNG